MSKKLLYIDTDVMANIDAADIIRIALDGYALACSGVGQVKSSLDREFFLSVGMEDDNTVFNAGILLFDLEKWRKLKIQERCFDFGYLYSDQLRSADQTILNGVFRGNIKILNENWNIACYPSTHYCDCTGQGIYHFLGTPKPWDICSDKLHNFHSAWMSESAKTALPFKRNNLSFFSSVKRSLRLSRSYYKLIKGKINKGKHV
jgi:lipopolysaccharide biosynthesis glycosyltransferase